MKKKSLTEYRAFCSKGYRLINLLSLVLLPIIGYFIFALFGPAAPIAIAPIILFILVFFDYYAFSGISARNQKYMEFLKTSVKGGEILDSALRIDMIIKTLQTCAAYLGCLVSDFVNSGEYFIPFAIIIIAFIPIAQTMTRFTLILTRRKGLTVMMQVLIVYLATTILSIISVMLVLVLPTEAPGVYYVSIPALVIFEILSVISAKLLLRDCITGFRSGFADMKE